LIERIHRLRSPVIFGTAPADGDDRRFVGRIVDRHGDSVQEPFVGVRGEVNGYSCLRGDRGRDLDIKHNLAVAAVGGGGLVLSTVAPDGPDMGYRDAEFTEVGPDIAAAIAAAQFYDAD